MDIHVGPGKELPIEEWATLWLSAVLLKAVPDSAHCLLIHFEGCKVVQATDRRQVPLTLLEGNCSGLDEVEKGRRQADR